MMIATVFGSPQGFFSPYRYADAVSAPQRYPALEARFAAAFDRAATGGMACPADVFHAIERHSAPLAALGGSLPAPRWEQTWYPRLDGAAAYAIVASTAPAQIVEVGSGHSTRFLSRAVADAGADGQITCIDPEPRAALHGLDITWRRRLLSDEDMQLFAALGPGDIAFFDSSHLLWPGSDVDLILNGILPALAPGVLIHIHDICLPDAYPQHWAWRGYTEQLGLGGWLAGGGADILWSSHFALSRRAAADHPTIRSLPHSEGAPETALWLIRR
ncbi:MAG: class I SAM-dependent methyltransferase [Pseudomonadota bacterium]